MMVEHVRRCREFTGPTPHSVAIVSSRFFLHISEMFSACLLLYLLLTSFPFKQFCLSCMSENVEVAKIKLKIP